MADYNTMVFNTRALAVDFIAKLLEFAEKDTKHKITINCYLEETNIWRVDWTQVHYDLLDERGNFKFVDYDEVIMKEVINPKDNSVEYKFPNEVDKK